MAFLKKLKRLRPERCALPVRGPDDPYLIWHYTTAFHLRSILKSQSLRPTAVGIAPGEMPLLWFSSNQDWELTANKMRFDEKSQTIKHLSREETEQYSGGLCRFGILFGEVPRWLDAARVAKTPQRIIEELKATGLAQGAKPCEWFATTRSIRLTECQAIEKFVDGRWESLV